MDEQDFGSPAQQFLQGLEVLSRRRILVRCDHFQQFNDHLSEAFRTEDLAKIVDFAAEQLGRWDAEWLFSPALTPDADAASEREAWVAQWQITADALIKAVPASGATLKKEKGLIHLRCVMEKRLEYNSDRTIGEFTSNVCSRGAFLLARIGLQSMVPHFCKRALFPPNTVGRINRGGSF